MKIIFKQILKYYLKFITKIILLIQRPLIISVTGSANEFFAKNEIKLRLEEAHYDVSSNSKNFNTEIGLPLAILNLPSGYNAYRNWPPIIWQSFMSLFRLKLPKILVLDLGLAKRGDMKYLMSLVKPKIAVITDITQRYLENFSSMDELVGEYKYFVKSIGQNDYLILNYDNPRIKKLAEFAKANIIPFGLEKPAPAIDNYWLGEIAKKTVNGQIVLVTNDREKKNYSINRFGEHHAYALLIGLIIKKVILNLK